MKNLFIIPLLTLSVLTFAARAEAAKAAPLVHHALKVTLHPAEHRLSAEDTVTIAGGERELPFLLHSGLAPTSPTPGVRIVRRKAPKGAVSVEAFTAHLPADIKTFVLAYGGTIHHALETEGKEYARGFRDTAGIIGEEGVSLSENSFWYPVFETGSISFSLTVGLPAAWDAVSQGSRRAHEKTEAVTRVTWDSPEPQESIFLIAAPFTEYSRAAGNVTAMVFLRTPDKALADKYLDATARYIAMYEKLIGPYPYRKFALVENFWETGFGMPSFTLLGPKVIRFPFIITSSYPHEILHNWWGNSVYPDYRSGNWSEGLTAYLADHLIKEQQGGGAEYRQTTLQKYADYVMSEREFPLAEFRSRHSASSEALGYGKALMLFHMLRREWGDTAFVAGLQEFYRSYKFKTASFGDLRKSFEKASGRSLADFFDQWVVRTGAPQLALRKAAAKKEGEGYLLSFSIEQLQQGPAYRLAVPVAVTMEGRGQAYETTVSMDKKSRTATLRLPARPLRVEVDPQFDLFRRLHRDELPPAISQALGAKKMLIVLPAAADSSLLGAYRELAKSLAGSGPDRVEVATDTEVAQLPSDRAVAVIGWENRFAQAALKAVEAYGVAAHRSGIRIGTTDIPRGNHAVVLTARNPKKNDMAVLFIAADKAAALPGLARKLPHYHKYSYLGFQGDEPVNIAKGRWPVLSSPMTALLPGSDGKTARGEQAKLAPRQPLAALPPLFSADRMRESVKFLSSEALQGRGFGSEGLDAAARYIAVQFKEAGLRPDSRPGSSEEGSYFQTWTEGGGDPETTAPMKNVIAILPGKKAEWADQSIVIGAHYDHLGLGWPDVREGNRGKVHPGADDNASGVAVLLELARVLGREAPPDRSIVFIAFTGEEAGRRGSKHYLKNANRKIQAMVNLDTVGRLGNGKLLVLGAATAAEWPHIVRGAGYVTGVEIATVAERLDSSDQVSFEEAGIPAIQLFSGPHLDYHRPTDTADKIDGEGLLKVAAVTKEVIEYLAARQEPLTAGGRGGSEGTSTKGASPKGERKAGLGIIPDFTFSGTGCRLAGVAPGSPAERCGLQEGDIIIRINNEPVSGLRDLSGILSSLPPGSRITVTFLRDGRERSAEAEVTSR